MGKLIFFDIDGTLALPGKAPSSATVRAIRSARKRGHMAFISTGRPHGLVPPEIQAVGFDGGIYSAGGHIVAKGNVIFDQPMTENMSRDVLEAVKEAGVFYTLECGSESFRSQPRILNQLRLNIQVKPIEEYNGEPIYKISFLSTTARNVDFLRQRLDGRVKLICFGNMVRHLPFIAGEISDPDINKGKALKQICAYLGVSQDDSIVFGDSMNDTEILQAAGIGIAMGNAETQVKEIADQVCESCEDDGIAKALARMGLI